tara:strand:- start:136 stop:507 length:372 start_codon:yes stop_codon:yes gene_type:complete
MINYKFKSGLETTNNNILALINTDENSQTFKLQAQQSDNNSIKKNITINPDGGNIGIGTNDPKTLLQLGNSFTLHADNNNSDYAGEIGFNIDSLTGNIFNTNYGAFQLHNKLGNLYFEVFNSS